MTQLLFTSPYYNARTYLLHLNISTVPSGNHWTFQLLSDSPLPFRIVMNTTDEAEASSYNAGGAPDHPAYPALKNDILTPLPTGIRSQFTYVPRSELIEFFGGYPSYYTPRKLEVREVLPIILPSRHYKMTHSHRFRLGSRVNLLMCLDQSYWSSLMGFQRTIHRGNLIHGWSFREKQKHMTDSYRMLNWLQV